MRRSVLPGALLGLSAAVALVQVAGLGPVRPAVALAFLAFVPGAAIVGLLPARDPVLSAALAVGLSLALGALVSEALALAGVWTAERTLAVLLAVSVAGALAQLARGRRRGRAMPEEVWS